MKEDSFSALFVNVRKRRSTEFSIPLRGVNKVTESRMSEDTRLRTFQLLHKVSGLIFSSHFFDNIKTLYLFSLKLYLLYNSKSVFEAVKTLRFLDLLVKTKHKKSVSFSWNFLLFLLDPLYSLLLHFTTSLYFCSSIPLKFSYSINVSSGMANFSVDF